MLVSANSLNESSKFPRTLSEYTAERRSSRSVTASGLLNTTICEPIMLKYKISVSAIRRRQTAHKVYIATLVSHHSPCSLAILVNPSQIGFCGKSNRLPMIGNPFGPGGYGERLEVSLFRATTKTITVTTTAKAGPRYFSRMDVDMVDRSGHGREVPGNSEAVLLPGTSDGFNGSVHHIDGTL